jgi:hypothetical protein
MDILISFLSHIIRKTNLIAISNMAASRLEVSLTTDYLYTHCECEEYYQLGRDVTTFRP